MTRSKTARRPLGSRHPAYGDLLMPIKCSLDLRQRLKVAAAEDGETYATMIWRLLDMRESQRARQRRAQPSPLHKPINTEVQL